MKEKEPGLEELHKAEEKESKLVVEEEAQKKNKEDYESLWDKYMRLCAEFDNARKRWEKERIETVKFANFFLLKDILVILDEMEQALKTIKEDGDSRKVIQGLEMTYSNFIEILKKKGVRIIEAKGKRFDPQLHEVITSKEVEDDEEHLVLEEIQKGYLMEDRVLRTSKVIVGIKKQSSKKEEDDKFKSEKV